MPVASHLIRTSGRGGFKETSLRTPRLDLAGDQQLDGVSVQLRGDLPAKLGRLFDDQDLDAGRSVALALGRPDDARQGHQPVCVLA